MKLSDRVEIVHRKNTFAIDRRKISITSQCMTPLIRKVLSINWVLVLVMLGLLMYGVYVIESAARHLPQGGEWYAERQRLWIVLGMVVYVVTSLIDYRLFKYLGIPMYVVGVGLMILAIYKGNAVHQLSVGGVSFQPAQFAVVAGIILISFVLQEMHRWHAVFNMPFVKVGVILVLSLVPLGLVAKMGDMGSALVWVPVIACVMLVSGAPFRYLALFSMIGLFLIPPAFYVVFPKVSPRGTDRVQLYIDTLQGKKLDVRGNAYAQHHVFMAVGRSGYKGLGHMADANKQSLHARRYIPWKTAHNDFIFAVIAEEQGFRGTMLLVTAFSLLVIQCIFVAYYSRDLSGQIIVSAVAALIFAYVFQSVGMCSGLLPITGIPLPLVSYSGTFVLMCTFMLGLVQSVWIHRNNPTPEQSEKSMELLEAV